MLLFGEILQPQRPIKRREIDKLAKMRGTKLANCLASVLNSLLYTDYT